MSRTWRIGVYPGSFNPPTTAHLAVSRAARNQRRLDRVIWSISVTTLGKERVERPSLDDRIAVAEAATAPHRWLGVMVTTQQLLADIAEGFDVLILGADKWAQINEPHWYGDDAERAAALARLPELAIAPRPPHPVPSAHALDLREEHHSTSSSAARDGATELMAPAARAYSIGTGTWREGR